MKSREFNRDKAKPKMRAEIRSQKSRMERFTTIERIGRMVSMYASSRRDRAREQYLKKLEKMNNTIARKSKNSATKKVKK